MCEGAQAVHDGPPRLLEWDGCLNVRDLGGYQTRDGRLTRWGAIVRADDGGVLFHCVGRKDRTGLIAALLHDIVGVPRETIGADYALTAECLRPLDENWLKNGPEARVERESALAAHMPRAEVMTELIAYLDDRYGGVARYLHVAGVTAQDFALIEARLLG